MRSSAGSNRVRHLLLLLLLSHPAWGESYTQVVISEYGDTDVLKVVEQEGLPEPGPGQVRVRVLTASASFTDTMVRRGSYPGISAELPYPPGYDLVGVVDKNGPGVSGLAVGQRVADLTVWGAYSEYTVHQADKLVPLPEGINDEEAVALILSYTTAYQMMYRLARVMPEQRILIHGASGAVGTALAQLGRVAGLQMYGTASAAKADYVRGLGVTPIDYRSEDFVQLILQETAGQGVDVVFDAIGPDNFERSYQVLAPGGQLIIYGLYKASLRAGEDRWGVLLDFARWQWQQLLWSWFPSEERIVSSYSIADWREEHPDWFRQDLSALFQLLQETNIRPQIWKVLPLEQAQQAHRHIEKGDVKGKIVLRVAD